MAKYAVIKNSKVVNIVVSDKPLEDNWILADDCNIGDSWDGKKFIPKPKPAPTEKQVNQERERRLDEGSAFSVPGLANRVPLTGRAFDQSVYLALLIRAQAYKAGGLTSPILTLRGADDVIYVLTPDQMISLISQAMTWFEAVMARSWEMKDKTGAFIDGIPIDYTNSKHWP